MLDFLGSETRDDTIKAAKTKMLISLRVSTADLHLCFSHMQKAGFLTIWLIVFIF